MQWHWGNIGSFLAGLAGLIAALFAVYGVIRYGPAWLRDSRARQQAQAAAARAQEALAVEQAEQIRLGRHRHLHGWSPHGIHTYGVALVTSPREMATAGKELAAGGPADYVILRVAESPEKHGNANRAHSLRQIIETEGYISRPPAVGEREALENGLDGMGIPRAGYG